jgi:hypothetical protein
MVMVAIVIVLAHVLFYFVMQILDVQAKQHAVKPQMVLHFVIMVQIVRYFNKIQFVVIQVKRQIVHLE